MTSERVQHRIDSLLDEADQAISQDDWPAVRQRANAVLAFDAENADALAYLAAADKAQPENFPGVAAPPAAPEAPPGPPLPTSFVNGRYEVERFLSEGGKKNVYLAHDTTLDRDVAFALIKTEGLDDASRQRITREAQAMGRLGDHPNIVTVYDIGEEAGQPYMVLPLLFGGDVESMIEKAENHNLSLEEAIRIASEICEGLVLAHDKGIVHRDLKPGNVWLTENGTAKIGDFGLAVAVDRSRLTQAGMMVGTVGYMPPEQAVGGEVTPQSDLYSLGCMLYEMVTGRPPFVGDESVAIIGQHINTPPVAPTWHNSACPRPLDALILHLLAKDPSERPRSASDVLAALNGMDLTATAESSPEEAQPLDSLAGAVFVGRQREMGELKARLEDALSGRGRLVTLVGEAGIGKTRTAQELATYAGLRSAQVLWGRCYEEQGMPPYWPWVQAIRSYVREKDPDQLRSEMGAGAADIAEVVPEVRERLPDLKPPPQLDTPEQARFRLFDSTTAFLKNASKKQPLVLVLDDLHWADQPSLLLLEFVARDLGVGRLQLLATYRDVEVTRRHQLSQTLGELTREQLFERVLLRGLSQDDVGRFIELVSGIAPVQGLSEAVYRQTEGNPLFVTEVVRLLVQEGELTPKRSDQRESWSVRIPEGVREVIGRRLDRLSERCNLTLTVSSVIGREFTLEQLKPLIDDLSEDRLLEVLEEALAARVIEELPRAVGRYQFTHALIQESLAEELSSTRRAMMHGRIGEVLEELYGDDVEAHAAEQAYHFVEAVAVIGRSKLVRYSLLAGERALATYAQKEALAHFERALATKEGQPVDAEIAALLFGLGRAQVATLPLYQIQEAVVTLSRAFDYYAEVGDVGRAVAVAEHPLPAAAGHFTGSGQLIARAMALVKPDSLEIGRLQSSYGRILGLEEGDYSGAGLALDQAQAIARREGDLGLEMRTLVAAAELEGSHDRWQDALRRSLQAIQLIPRIDDPRNEMLARYWATIPLIVSGDPKEGDLHAAAMLSPAERLRHHFYLARTMWAHICPSHCRGSWQAARDFSDRGLAVSSRESRLLSSRILLEYELGEVSQGQDYLDRLLEVVQLTSPGPTLEHSILALVIPMVARITGIASRFELAEAAAETTLSSPSVSPLVTSITRTGLALMAVQRGDTLAAQEQYTALEPARGPKVSVIWGNLQPECLLGLPAQTIGDLDQSVDHFEEALAFCRKAGYLPELAWSCCDCADTLLQRNGTGDQEKAVSLLDESPAISSELGMQPLMERVLSKRQIVKA